MSDRDEETKKQIVDYYSTSHCGLLHFGWAVDALYTRITNDWMIPSLQLIHAELVRKGIDEKNLMWHGDADGKMFYIEHPTVQVIVYTGQSRDYLFMINQEPSWFENEKPKYSLHIRRIFRTFKRDSISQLKKATSSIKNILDNVETFEEFADDHSDYPQRPSLELYRKQKFTVAQDKESIYHGMGVDPGYVLSYEHQHDMSQVDHAVWALSDINQAISVHIPCMAAELRITIPKLGS